MAKTKKRVKKNLKDTKMLVVIVIGLVLLIGVAYAALSQTLEITTTAVTSSGISWNVGFQSGNVTGTKGGTSTADVVCGTATVTGSSVSVAASTLSKPDDSCTYALVIKNLGDIDATLASVNPSAPTSTSCTNSGASMVCGNITYYLSTTNNVASPTLLTTGGTLVKTTGTLNVYLIIKYTGTTVGSEVQQNGGKFTLIYNQA